jgi:hypothetical protein
LKEILDGVEGRMWTDELTDDFIQLTFMMKAHSAS